MSNLSIFSRISPNFNKKIRPKKDIKVIVIHYTGMQSEVEAINLDEASFETLTHRKQTNFDPFTESSEIAFADASYEYDRMITYTLSFPEGPSNRFGPKNACVSAVNFLTRQSIKDVPDDTLFAFLNFLQASGIPEKLSSDILTAYQESADFSLIGQSLALEFAAGSIEHVRGNFFVINVKTLNPFSNQALEEM